MTQLSVRLEGAILSPEGAICTGDRSFKDVSGTACFTILPGPDEQEWRGKDVESAFKLKLGSLYGIVVLIHAFCKRDMGYPREVTTMLRRIKQSYRLCSPEFRLRYVDPQRSTHNSGKRNPDFMDKQHTS